MNTISQFVLITVLASAMLWVQEPTPSPAAPATVIGYLRDSGCVHRFHEVVKPLPNGCLEACVRAGSPLIILTRNEEVYHPISAEMPDVDIRQKLIPLAGKLVKVTGHVYDRDNSKAIAVERIEEVTQGESQ